MKICLEDGQAVEVAARGLIKGETFEFPCGCSFPCKPDEPWVHGQHPPIVYEPDQVPLDCPATWSLIGSGKTKGIFQLESSLGRHWAKRLKPENLDHLAALTAILRPGCLKSKSKDGVSMTELYCRRKNGEEDVTYEIEALRPILDRTFGILVFQESAMQIARDLAGFDLQEADQLRKAIGKKLTEVMAKTRVMFLDKAKSKGVLSEEEAISIFDGIEKSQRYSFNASHAYAYAVDTFWSAHWKAHFPLYFYTSYLYWAHKKSKPLVEMRELINDAKNFDIVVTPPRLVELRSRFGTDGLHVAFGLVDIKDVGQVVVDRMRAAMPGAEAKLGTRFEWTWYQFLTEFSHVCGKTAVRKMVEVGAVRDFDQRRQRLIEEHDAWTRLTDKEREAILGLAEPIYRKVPVTEEVETREPKYSPKAMKAYKAEMEEYGKVCHQCEMTCEGGLGDPDFVGPTYPDEPTHPEPTGFKTVKKHVPIEPPEWVVEEDDDGHPVLLDPARPVDNLTDALEQLLNRVVGHTRGSKKDPSRPVYSFTKDRRPKIEALRDMLRHPPSAAYDRPYWVAKVEEENLGVPVSCSHADAADRSIVTHTVRQYLDGAQPAIRDGMIVLGVEVVDLREWEVKSGQNQGKPMARLTVSDGTGVLEECVCFPDAWAENKMRLHRPGTIVGLGGRRDYRDGISFFVDKVWEI